MSPENYSAISEKAAAYAASLYKEGEGVEREFHNIDHTRSVVSRTNEIAGHYQLSDREMFILFVAAWFHDIGYLFVEPAYHEEKSVEVMQDFMKQNGLPDIDIQEIAACILATKAPRKPAGILQEIICDADTFHFGTKEFPKTNKNVYKELLHTNEGLDKQEFLVKSVEMLAEHKFFTSYCRSLLHEEKIKNMKKLKKKAGDRLMTYDTTVEEAPVINEKQGTTKGMQTMLRLTSSNHIQLSEMADNKANILISVNAIIISVILSILLRKLSTDPYLTIPTILFLTSSVATIVVAILATRPKLSTGKFAEEDVQNKKTNLLFFGNFHKMPQEDYENAMRTMMNDPDYLYSSIIQDIYSLGAVLGKKYRLVRIAYNLFMFGIIISVAAFAVASLLNTGAPAQSVPNSSGSPF